MVKPKPQPVWEEFLVQVRWHDDAAPMPVCGLCGNTGIIDTGPRGRVTTPAGHPCPVIQRPCICPNGRAVKRQLNSRRPS